MSTFCAASVLLPLTVPSAPTRAPTVTSAKVAAEPSLFTNCVVLLVVTVTSACPWSPGWSTKLPAAASTLATVPLTARVPPRRWSWR